MRTYVRVRFLSDDGTVQLAPPCREIDRAADLDAALDGVRARFGSAAVTRGALAGRGHGLAMPQLPD